MWLSSPHGHLNRRLQIRQPSHLRAVRLVELYAIEAKARQQHGRSRKLHVGVRRVVGPAKERLHEVAGLVDGVGVALAYTTRK